MQQQAVSALTLQFLAFVAGGGRTYAEVMEGWRTSCPRLSIWEDAVLAGLVRLDNGGGRGRNQALVKLTVRGRVLLDQHPAIREAAGPAGADALAG
jgi:hypothetical protein